MASVSEHTGVTERTGPVAVGPARRPLGVVIGRLLSTTDHKVIGQLYLITSFAFFLVGGIMALIIRAELAEPGLQIVNEEVYNQLFTMHGTIMLLLFATPLFVGFANVIMPVQIGAPDVAFPRLNMFSYWLFLFGGLITLSAFLTPGGAADFGWTAYSPLSNVVRSPSVGGDLWIMGLWMAGLGTILGGVNFVTTIITMRAPGMTMFRMPIFCWNILVTSILVLIAFPILAAALLVLEADRRLGAHVFDAANGGALLWQHLFWFFGHPEVYIIALPFFGIITEVLPVFSRKPVFGYIGLVAATIAIGALSIAVWAHHMFVTGGVNLPFFSFMTFLIAVPTGVKFFNWIGTMWGGSVSLDTPMLWSLGFLVTFLLGGLTGIILASPVLDYQLNDIVLRGRALPLRGLRHRGVRDVRRVLLLVAEDDRADARRAPRQGALLAAVHRLPHHVPGAALARCRGHAAALRVVRRARGLHHAEPGVQRRCLHPRPVDAAVPLQRLQVPPEPARGRRTTRGAGAAPSSGPPVARPHATTSTACPESAPTAPPSTPTTQNSSTTTPAQNLLTPDD